MVHSSVLSAIAESAVELSMSALPPKSRHVQCTRACLLWAKSGHVVLVNLAPHGPCSRNQMRVAAGAFGCTIRLTTRGVLA